MIEYRTNWRAASACLNADPDMFFPVAVGTAASKQVSLALRICEGCAVRQHCLDFAMRSGEKDGIWGGTTPEERIRARRASHRRLSVRARRAAAESRAS
jgi:WhiB family transcriptional regulator, redox-sensing transcriptional regulator